MRITELLETRHPLPFNAIENDHSRSGLSWQDRFNYIQQALNIIALHCHDIKTESPEFSFQIKWINNFIQLTIKLLFVPVHKHSEVIQTMMRDKLESFPTLAFIKFAIADNTKTRFLRPASLCDSAIPPAMDIPCPSDPVVLSTPHVFSRSG